jgi:hypothetical protein
LALSSAQLEEGFLVSNKTKPPKRLHLDRFAGEYANHLADGDPDDLLDPKYVAAKLHVSVEWLEAARDLVNPDKNYGPPCEKLGPHLVRYRRGTLVGWLQHRWKSWSQR